MVPFTYNVRSMMVRKITTIATALGLMLVVAVFAAGQMLGAGVERAMVTSGRPDNVIILRKGADSELGSAIQNENLNLFRGHAAVSQAEGGGVVGEIVIVITAELAADPGKISNVLVRGMPPEGIKFRPEFNLINGRMPKPGTNEVIVGKAISGRFKGVSLGERFELRRNRPLQVVGEFEAGGSANESEVWGDLDVIRTSLGREQVVSSARVRLTNPSQFDAYRDAIEGDKRFSMKVMRETDYYRKSAGMTAGFLTGFATVVSILFAIAAMIGAAITMNGAVAHRTREIGTLRALGFTRFSILTSFVLEAIFLALIGGVVGLAVVMAFSFKRISVMNFQTFSDIVIQFDATPQIIISALVFSAVMGLLGGLFPAIRASRVSPVEAMRG